MRLSLIILFFSFKLVSQDLTVWKISKYVKTIDSLRTRKQLKKIELSNMSWCGGAVTGYFWKGKLVYINSTHGAEFGYSGMKVYLKDTINYKITKREQFVNWKKSEKELAKDPINEKKLIYGDTSYILYCIPKSKLNKFSNGKSLPLHPDDESAEHLQQCASVIRKELENEIIERSQIKTEVSQDTTSCFFKYDQITNRKIYNIVDQIPQFPKGTKEMMRFISDNRKRDPVGYQVTGTVFLAFTVESNGKLSNKRVIKGIEKSKDEDALRVLDLMPDWIPGTCKGVAVPVEMNIPVKFSLD